MEFQNLEPLVGTSGENKSLVPRYLALRRFAHSPPSFWHNFQIHLTIRAMFISLVVRMPKPPNA
jgi:hypothetical protein